MKKQTVKILMQCYNNREKMTVALADSGYAVWVEKKEHSRNWPLKDIDYYICFDLGIEKEM